MMMQRRACLVRAVVDKAHLVVLACLHTEREGDADLCQAFLVMYLLAYLYGIVVDIIEEKQWMEGLLWIYRRSLHSFVVSMMRVSQFQGARIRHLLNRPRDCP